MQQNSDIERDLIKKSLSSLEKGIPSQRTRMDRVGPLLSNKMVWGTRIVRTKILLGPNLSRTDFAMTVIFLATVADRAGHSGVSIHLVRRRRRRRRRREGYY